MAKDEERLLSSAGVVAQIQGSELFCHVEGALVDSGWPNAMSAIMIAKELFAKV